MGLSRLYSAKIDRIPVVSHTPPPLPGVEDDFENMTSVGIKSNGQDHTQQQRFNAGAEDAAFQLERAVLQDYPLPKQRSKIDDSRKRPVPGPGSDLESEMDNSKTADAPATKKRRLDNAISNGVDLPTAQESKISSKTKGKGKQEMSPDSVSVTPKPGRKKPGPKKRVGLALELDNEQGRPTPSGDVTPAVSRPTSPALTHTPMVYELDEVIPPMKKAKKVDDNAMMKRIKSLEEAQRKVWTNIARRDVAKVILSFKCMLLYLMLFTRFTNTIRKDISYANHSWNVSPNWLPFKHVSHSQRRQREPKTLRQRRNA